MNRIDHAVEIAKSAHKGQARKTGEPYIIHPLAVKKILEEWGMDDDTIIAGILHDTVEDTDLTLEDIKNEFLAKTDWGTTVDPVGLRIILNDLYARYGKPLFIVENGLGAYDVLNADGSVHDPSRIKFLKEHIEQMHLAVDDGVDVLGYTSWGCIDLISQSKGQMSKRYGYIYVDKNDDGSGSKKRFKKDSFYWYKKVIASNGENLSMEE